MDSGITPHMPMTRDLLFDLGGVIVDIRRENCVEAFRRLGFADIADYLGDYGQRGVFLALEQGAVSPEQWRAQVRHHLPSGVTDGQIDDAFNAFITGIPLERLQALRRLRAEGHRTFVISNTNPVMWHGPILRAFAAEGRDINAYFDGVVTSFEAGCCKPDERIFRLCIERFGLAPAATTFFDDSEANCRAAAAMGFRTIHVPPSSSFLAFI